MWTEIPKGKGKKAVNKDRSAGGTGAGHGFQLTLYSGRFISKLFLRGDSVVLGEQFYAYA